MRAVVTVGTGKYQDNLARLLTFPVITCQAVFDWSTYPRFWPPHSEIPYAFKYFALQYAIDNRADVLLWLDSSIVPIQSLEPIWEHIEREGYWIPRNAPQWTTGDWCSDAALPLLGITREESFGIPHAAATAFGFDIKKLVARKFFLAFLDAMASGSFKGPWTNYNHEASNDYRVFGHRHDQTAISVIAHKLRMTLTPQPKFFSDSLGETEETILTVVR